MEIFLERKNLPLVEQEETNRDALSSAASSSGNIKAKAIKLKGITLPNIEEDIESYFHYRLAFSDQRPESPQTAQKIIQEKEEEIKEKEGKSKKSKNRMLEKKLHEYEQLELILEKVHSYLTGRPALKNNEIQDNFPTTSKQEDDSEEEKQNKAESSHQDTVERPHKKLKRSFLQERSDELLSKSAKFANTSSYQQLSDEHPKTQSPH